MRKEAATASGRIADWERLPVENEIRLGEPAGGLCGTARAHRQT